VSSAPTTSALAPGPYQPPGEPGRVDGHERHDEQQEQHVGEDGGETREQVGHQPGDVGEADLAERGMQLIRAHADRAEPGAEVVDQCRETVLVGRDEGSELGDGQRQRRREAEDQEHQREQGDRGRQPHRRTPSAQDAGQWMHTDHQDERQQHGPDDRGELAQRQNPDQEPGPAEHDDQPTRHQPALSIGHARIGHAGNVSAGSHRRHHSDRMNPSTWAPPAWPKPDPLQVLKPRPAPLVHFAGGRCRRRRGRP
jgi:hypothetical protein